MFNTFIGKGLRGQPLVSQAHSLADKAEKSTLIGPMNIRIGHPHPITLSGKTGGHVGRYRAFTHPPLVGHDHDDLANICQARFNQPLFMTAFIQLALFFLWAKLTGVATATICGCQGLGIKVRNRHREILIF
ncbi:hypothetical protein F753_07015 [Stutzerimonas chloritidismutans AW-1]|uniref:Uncharacterized protein n=1 Tax=Stutzerimonas chloritidismutans AW-1 TaxID=1263865 RepID=V4QK46_STUCH|nr:hypothetical protein F753_07015 [Stutzerimonas chloritidismutans AW-1]